jgi:two-component system OmpR family sensor kinase
VKKAVEQSELRRASMRLAVRFSVLILVLFAILGGMVYAVVSASQSEQTQRSLIDAEHVDSPRDVPPGTFIAFGESSGVVASSPAPSGFPDRATMEQVARTGQAVEASRVMDGRHYIVRTDADSGQVVQVAVDQGEHDEELQRLALALMIAGLGAALGTAVVAWWMSRGAMRPLADALALQRRFVMDASHELRTPLTLLTTRAQLLRRRTPSGPGTDAFTVGLDEVIQDARTLTDILEDLLIAADPRAVTETTVVDLCVVADEVVASLLPEAQARGLRLTREGDRAAVRVRGATVALSRLCVALVSNALDHARTTVRVDVSQDAGHAVVRVADDGPGFAPELRTRAFDRFAGSRDRSSESGQRHYGLGLALAAEVARRHSGTVSIDTDRELGGALLVVRLPLARGTAPLPD